MKRRQKKLKITKILIEIQIKEVDYFKFRFEWKINWYKKWPNWLKKGTREMKNKDELNELNK